MSPHTESTTLEELRIRGYETYLVPMPGGHVSAPAGEFDAALLRIDERHRFVGEFVPADERMVFAARWTDADGNELLGVMKLGCGANASQTDKDVLRRVGVTGYHATVADLERLRDEVRLQLHLAGRELDDGWVSLEKRWNDAAPRLKAAAAVSAGNLETATSALLVELEQGYLRLRDALTPNR